MDVKQLERLSRHHGVTQGERHQKSASLFDEGMSCFILAHETHFENPVHLQQTCTLLIESITYNYQDVRPFLALAYLFALVEDSEVAEEYIQQALEIEPENPVTLQFASALKEQIAEQRKKKLSLSIPIQHSAHLSVLPNLDTSYDDLKDYVLKSVKKIMEQPIPKVLPTIKTVETFETRLHEFIAVQEYIRQQINILAPKIDTSKLEELAKPITTIIQRVEKAAKASGELYRMKQRIVELDAKTDSLHQTLSSLNQTGKPSIALQQEHLDEIATQCDSIADGLDAFENSPYPTETLVHEYEQLVVRIEQIQQTLKQLKEV